MTYYARILDRAIDAFGSLEMARDWLEKMNSELGVPPVQMLNTKEGSDQVLRLIRAADLEMCPD